MPMIIGGGGDFNLVIYQKDKAMEMWTLNGVISLMSGLTNLVC
jgi:hypothetical protein